MGPVSNLLSLSPFDRYLTKSYFWSPVCSNVHGTLKTLAWILIRLKDHKNEGALLSLYVFLIVMK